MNFAPARPARRPAENIVPMINVVFLLLIFFLMTAQITATVPFDVVPPASQSDTRADGVATLNVSAEGGLYFAGQSDEAVWPLLSALEPQTAILIRADAAFSASGLTALINRLAELGAQNISLVTEASR